MTKQSVTYDRSEADIVLASALRIARRIVECGGEIRRAEETVEFICRAYGIEEMEVFAILSEIQATIRTPDGRYITQIVRIHSWSNDLGKLEAMNSLSRKICSEKPAPCELEQLYKNTDRSKRDHPIRMFLSYYIGAFAFCLFFGGSLYDAVIAGLIGLALFALDRLKPMWMNTVAHGAVASTTAGVLCLVLTHFGIGDNMNHIMMGTIMLLTPGLAFGNALRDLLCGDLIAGSLRLLQVILAAISIGAGLVVTVWLGGILF